LFFFQWHYFFVKDHFANNNFGSGEEGRQKDFYIAGLEEHDRELKEAINERKKIRERFKNKIESIEKEQENSNEQERDVLKQKRDHEKIRLTELQGQREVLQGAIDFVKKHKKEVNFLMGNLSDASDWLVALHESAEELLKRNYDLSSEPDGFLNSADRIEQLVEDLRKSGKKILNDADKLEKVNKEIIDWQNKETVARAAAFKYLENDFFSPNDLEDPR